MPKPGKPCRPAKPTEPPLPAPLLPLPRHPRSRRATAERRLRILERLTAGVSVAAVACGEGLTPRRVRQIVVEALARRDVEPPADFIPLQIGWLGDAMRVARTKMTAGDLQATDRVVQLVCERDRDRGVARAEMVAPRPPAAAAKQNVRQPLEKTESGEAGDCAGASL